MTLQLRLPADHPVVTEDFCFATVTIAGHSFTLERETPLRPLAERLFTADYSSEFTSEELICDELTAQ